MTVRLYYTDAYTTEFTATVIAHDDDGRRVYLRETAFYPTSGGQPHDVGTIGGVAVVDVIDEDERVAHVLAAPLADAAATAPAVIDWTRRFDHMQQHTGQHLLSAVFEDLFGVRTVSVHFGADASTLDLDAAAVTREQLDAAEDRATALVRAAIPVRVTFEDASTATGLRKPSDRAGELRIVSIEGVDRSACGGTHVRSTAEIGTVFVRGSEKIRGGTRVTFLCGTRALRRARRDHQALAGIAEALSASLDDVPALVAAQSERLKESDGARRKLGQELAAYRVRERYDAAAPSERGVRAIIVRDAASMDELRTLAQAALALPRAALVGAVADPPSILLAASDDSGIDAGKALKALVTDAGGRGGGSPRIAQGSVPTVDARDALLERLLSSVL